MKKLYSFIAFIIPFACFLCFKPGLIAQTSGEFNLYQRGDKYVGIHTLLGTTIEPGVQLFVRDGLAFTADAGLRFNSTDFSDQAIWSNSFGINGRLGLRKYLHFGGGDRFHVFHEGFLLAGTEWYSGFNRNQPNLTTDMFRANTELGYGAGIAFSPIPRLQFTALLVSGVLAFNYLDYLEETPSLPEERTELSAGLELRIINGIRLGASFRFNDRAN